MRWRLETAYGEPDAVPPAEEIARFVTWSAEMRRRMGPRRRVPVVVKLVAIAGLLALMAWVNLRAGDIEGARNAAAAAGYPGLLLASVVSGFNLVWPVPIAAFYPFFIESGFQPVPTLATIALGMTGGDLLGYLIGDATRHMADGRLAGFRARAESLHDRHRLLPLGLLFLYAAFVPLPQRASGDPDGLHAVLAGRGHDGGALRNVIFNTGLALGVSLVFGGGG